MGAWGFRIEENDTYCDIQYIFKDTYKATKKDVERTIDCIVSDYEIVTDFDECNLYICLADESIRVKQPNERIIKKAIELIESGVDCKGFINQEARKQVTTEWVSKVKKHLKPTNV